MSLIIDEHRQYLADRARVRRYEAALREVVRPDDVVLDLASGTSILGMLACRAGAARVYSIEADGIASVARRLAESNGCGERLTVIRSHSSDVHLPEPADVLVSDQIGRFGFDAGLLTLLQDARARLLRPDARLVPSALSLVIAPVEQPRLSARVAFWGRRHGFDLSAVRPLAANTIYPARFAPGDLLSEPRAGARLDLSREAPASLEIEADVEIRRDGRLDGLGGWFTAQLSPSIAISNAPTDPDRIRRRQAFMPIAVPASVRAGDRITASVRVLWNAMIVSWTVVVRSPGGEPLTFRHSTLHGMLLDASALRSGDPSYRPVLTPRGAARRTVLELCDGGHALRDIEAEVYARHRALFVSPAEAELFVGEVVSVYTRDGS